MTDDRQLDCCLSTVKLLIQAGGSESDVLIKAGSQIEAGFLT